MRDRIVGAAVVVLYALVMLFAPKPLFVSMVYFLGALMVGELFSCAKLEKLHLPALLLFSLFFLLTVNLPQVTQLLSFYFSSLSLTFYSGVFLSKLLMALPVIFGAVLLPFAVSFYGELPKGFFPALFFLLYLTLGVSSIALLDKKLFLLLLSVVWSTDTFAYLVGKRFGRRKLVPKLSPKKTVEGALGGSVAGTLFSAVVAVKAGLLSFSLSSLIILFFFTIISQLGDLLESGLKRLFGVKDSGNTIPGHGGLLDRLDSAIAVAPLLLFLGGSYG